MPVSLTGEGRLQIERFAQTMQHRQREAGPWLSSALAKARGQALRLALVLELLWWCAEDGASAPPNVISAQAFATAAELVGGYFVPMAERVCQGTVTTTRRECNAARLARWILRTRAVEVHIRHLQREVRLAGLRTAADIRAAAALMVSAGWLRPPIPSKRFGPRARLCYRINPRLWRPTV